MSLAVEEVLEVLQPAGQQVVDADHLVPLGEGALAEVRAEEAGAARDDHSAHERASATRAAGLPTACGRRSGTPSGRPIET